MSRWRYVWSAVVFALSLGVGFWIASYKGLWNDEFFSLASSIHNPSYWDMMSGKIQEGNNSPLFYLLQKIFFQLIGYQVPAQWINGNWSYAHYPSQFIVRIIPVVCMSLSIALVFSLFYKRYSWSAGVYSLLMWGASYMLWVYWAESRPYAMVVLLTTIQTYLLIRFFEDKSRWDKGWGWLALTHLLLSLTFILSLGQILAAAMILWFLGHRNFKQYLWLVVIPTAICLFYYMHAPRYNFWFDMTPEQLVRDNFPRERFYILFLMIACVLWEKFSVILPWGKKVVGNIGSAVKPYLFFSGMVLGFTFIILGLFALKAAPNQTGFTVVNRYFIYLTPIGVVAATWFSIAVLKFFENYRWVQGLLIIVMLYWMVKRFYKIVDSAIRSIMGI